MTLTIRDVINNESVVQQQSMLVDDAALILRHLRHNAYTLL